MKILISDYKDSMMPDHEYETALLQKGLPRADIIIYEYTDEKRAEFIEMMKEIDVLLTAFINIDNSVFQQAKQLKLISLNATGYDNIDLDAATRHRVGVCPVGEYCTNDVAEHTIALMMALNKNLKAYSYSIEKQSVWRYELSHVPCRIELQTLGIFGLGKIGKRVAKLAQGLGMNVIATDIAVSVDEGKKIGVEMVSADEIYAKADVISNHMNLKAENTAYFSSTEFNKMKRKPLFLNLGRGLSVNETDLAKALDANILRGAGLDVLKDETPSLNAHILVHRENVIITPHSAFYSQQSMRDLQRISCENIIHYLSGEKEKVYKLVNTGC